MRVSIRQPTTSFPWSPNLVKERRFYRSIKIQNNTYIPQSQLNLYIIYDHKNMVEEKKTTTLKIFAALIRIACNPSDSLKAQGIPIPLNTFCITHNGGDGDCN